MWFWLFMLAMVLLMPTTMIEFGRYFIKKSPRDINSVFGYRTTMSMKNKDTWVYAHKICGKIWFICGWVLLPLTIAGMFLVLKKAENLVGTVGGIFCGVQMLFLIGTIAPTEIMLRKTFDKNGIRKIKR